jgi:hypothetical protein
MTDDRTPGTSVPRHQSRDEGYQRSLELHHEIESLYPRVEQYKAYFRGLTRVDSTLPHPPGITGGTRVDPLVCALAIKASTTKRAIVAVCELGDGDNALALARVLLENACLPVSRRLSPGANWITSAFDDPTNEIMGGPL